MKYSNVRIAGMGYELPPIVVSSDELEERLQPLYKAIHIPKGQLESMTGISERRYWEVGYPLSMGAALAAKKAIESSDINADDIEALIYGGVCREHFEPATACHVAAHLKQLGIEISSHASLYDISNACLGVVNGIVDIANRVQLGQIKAGMVVSSESAREIVDITIERMLANNDMNYFKTAVATLTGGSGSVAIIIADQHITTSTHEILGGTIMTAPQHHMLCRWGIEPLEGQEYIYRQFMSTDAVGVLENGVALGKQTWEKFLNELGWKPDDIDRLVCHQVGAPHRRTILRSINIPEEKDFVTYEYLGNTGTVALPISLAIAHERGFLRTGDNVGLLGIGSGLNCIMLGAIW